MDKLAFASPDEAPVEEKVNLDTTNTSFLSDNVLSDRANRADFALGEKSPGQQTLRDAFRSGQEPQIRHQTAALANVEFQQEKLNKIRQLSSQGIPVTDKDVHGIMAAGTTPEANPDTVFEDKFAKNVVTAGVIGDPGKNLVFQTAFEQHPDRTREGIQIAQAAVSRKHQAQDVLEHAEAAHNQLPWFDFSGQTGQQDKAGDLANSLVTFGLSQYVNQRNLVNASPSNSFLPGSNKLEQIQYLYLLPHDQFKPALMAAAGPGSELWKQSPHDAVNFIRSAVKFSTSDAYAENLLGIANVAGLVPAGMTIRGINRLVKGVETVEAGVQSMDAALRANQGVGTTTVTINGKTATVVGKGDKGPLTQVDEVLNASSKPEQKFYVPEAAVKRPWESTPRAGEIRVENGKPRIFTQDGAEVTLGRTPEVGHIPLEVTPGKEKTTFSTSRGSTYTVAEDGTTIRDRAAGAGSPGGKEYAGGIQKQSEKTIYVSATDLNHLAAFQEENAGRRSLVNDAGKWGVLQVDGPKAGKFIGKKIAASEEPAKGLYPVEIWDQGDKVHFGNRITSVEKNTAPGVKFGATIVSKEELETRTALADIVKSQAETNPEAVLAKMGMHEEAATVGAQRIIDDKITQAVKLGDPEVIRRNVPSLGSPQLYYSESNALSRERADRLAQEAIQSSVELTKAIVDPVRVERMTSAALDKALEIAKKQVSEKYNRASDAILDAKSYWDSGSNTHYIETRFGKKDGTLFDSSVQANHYRTFQYRLGDAATVQQEGNQFYLSHIQHADETQSGARNLLIVSGNETPRGLWNSLLSAVSGKFAPLGNSVRSSAYTTSPFQMNNRVVATHSPSIMRNAIEDVAKDIQALGGKWTTNERHEMQEILEHNRDYMSPEGVRGQFYKSALEFETAFHGKFKKLPSEKQIVAYDQFTRLSDLDWTLREFDVLRDKARLGVRNYNIPFGKSETGEAIESGWFNGKVVKDFNPKATPNANVYVVPEKKFTTKYDLQKDDPVSKQINDKLKSGEYQIIQSYAPREKPLRDATGVRDDIHFAVVDKYKDKAVSFGENVPYHPGGHVIYQDQHYIKQPNIAPGTNGAMTHYGDTTLKAFGTEREAKLWADKYNIVRGLVHAGDDIGLQNYINAGHLPETLPEIKRMFADGTFNTDHPFVHTFSGRDTLQSSEALARQYPGLKDTFSAYNMSQVQSGEFLADRGTQLNTIANKGTEANPLYANVASRLYDPYTALKKGLGQIVRERWMGDYKISAAESWVQEFGMLFDQSKLPIEKLRQNPVYWVNHAIGNIDSGMMKTNPELVTAAMTARKNIQNFLGARDETGALLDGIQAKLVDKIANRFGDKTATAVEETFLPAIKSAPEYARHAAFHAVIGMFNPVQLIQQAQGLTHVLSLAPQHAFQSTSASALMRMYRYTEDATILGSAADKAAMLGWKRADFLEAVDGWKRSGVHNIGGEAALLNVVSDPKIFRNGVSAFLDKGTVFFKAGESIVRDTSWFTAYREWKVANPTGVLDNRAIGDIGNRFQVLSMDMTRASNSALNEGIFSPATQFWTWNMRFAEQMLGNRLTLGEKARAFTTYSALYGIPATLGGISMGVIPMANYGDIREYALAHGINVHEKYYQALSEGLPTFFLNSLTGHETSLQRFGPNATQVSDILDGKKNAYEVLGGASAGFAAQAMTTVAPAFMYGFSAFKKDSNFPLKMNDLVNLAENVSSFNNAEKAVIGWNLGEYISKREGKNTEVDKFESVLLGLGLNPQRVNDAYVKLDYLKHLEKAQKPLEKKIQEDWLIAMKAGLRGDYQTMTEYMGRVQGWTAMGNFTKAQEVDMYKRATKGNESLVDSVERRFREDNPNLQSIPAYKQYLENQKKN